MKHGVIIGRFQPVTFGHIYLIKKATAEVDHLHIFVGSSNLSPSVKNPFTFGERSEMLMRVFVEEKIKTTTHIKGLPDTLNDLDWQQNIIKALHNCGAYSSNTKVYTADRGDDISIRKIGYEIAERSAEGLVNTSATQLREAMYKGERLTHLTPSYIVDICSRKDLSYFHKEIEYFEWEKKAWSASVDAAPFPFPEFNTADAIIYCFQREAILTIRRKFHPGKGLLALPGGFKSPQETFLMAARREAKEETGIDLKGISPVDHFLVEAATRGVNRTTAVYTFHVSSDLCRGLKAGDDACDLEWVPVRDLKDRCDEFFLDHGLILQEVFNNV